MNCENVLPLVWLIVDFLTVEVFLVAVLSLDWLVDGVGLDRKSAKKNVNDKLCMLYGLFMLIGITNILNH